VDVSDDPGVEDLIYDLGTRTYQYPPEAKPDLSVVHIRCVLPDAAMVKDPGLRTPDHPQPGPAYDTRPPYLNGTDFEQGLEVIFKIADQTYANVSDMKDRINTDFVWDALPDKLMTEQDKIYEDYVAGLARDKYEWLKAAKDNDSLVDEDMLNSQWYGEVGIMIFSRSRAASREFMWSLHKTDEDPSLQKVSQTQPSSIPKLIISVSC
jgi:hypothetical protein